MPRYRQMEFAIGPPLSPVVRDLMMITGLVFLATYVPAQIFHWDWPFAWFGLIPYLVTHHLFLWQLVTYLFLHGGWFHIIFNLFGLWMFGCELERLWGRKRFLFFFFFTGAGAGLCNVLLDPSSRVVTIGNSGVVYGVLLAYGLLFPERPILLWLIIPMKAKWFALLFGSIEFIASLSAPGSGVSHVAHLGGMLFAFLFLRARDLPFLMHLRLQDWRRARLRRRFEVYMRDEEKKHDPGRWVN